MWLLSRSLLGGRARSRTPSPALVKRRERGQASDSSVPRMPGPTENLGGGEKKKGRLARICPCWASGRDGLRRRAVACSTCLDGGRIAPTTAPIPPGAGQHRVAGAITSGWQVSADTAIYRRGPLKEAGALLPRCSTWVGEEEIVAGLCEKWRLTRRRVVSFITPAPQHTSTHTMTAVPERVALEACARVRQARRRGGAGNPPRMLLVPFDLDTRPFRHAFRTRMSVERVGRFPLRR